jgi:prepilin-type N-terminal cleavage/methylation domain-containing protein
MEIFAKLKLDKLPHIQGAKGFTLIELLVVISIIGMLAGIVLVSMTGVRGKARDARRKSDLDQIEKAVELYNINKETYQVYNSGWGSSGGAGGCGCGWFSYEGDSYGRSIARALAEEKLIGFVRDPTGGDSSSPSSGYAYMLYLCGNGFYVYAKLEAPSAQDLATCNADSCCDGLRSNYGMNYAVGHR